MGKDVERAATPVQRFTEIRADERRVCCCVCPVAHPGEWDLCASFIEPGDRVVLDRVSEDRVIARCPPCAAAVQRREARR